MLTIKPVKSLQGKLEISPSPDLFLLATIVAIAAHRQITISPVRDTPLIRHWIESFKNIASFELSETGCAVKPFNNQDASAFLLLNYDVLPYKDLIVFTLLGLGKTIAFRSISPKRLESWCKEAKKFGCIAEIAQYDGNPGLCFKEIPPTLNQQVNINENDIGPVLGLNLGLRRSASYLIGFAFSNPLRTIATHFGFEINLKSLVVKENDPIARRIRMMQDKKKQASAGQQFTFNINCTHTDTSDESLPITIPGDEVLSSIMVAAKCLLPKGTFSISNMPLETWATPVLSFIRKMGSKVSVQETHRTSFESTGILSIQKCDLVGRKVECKPAGNFETHLPAMIILAAFAKGQSVFRSLEDLRNNEPDGIDFLESCIRTLGARHGEMPDGIVMDGGRDFDGFDLQGILPSHIAGSLAVAGLKCMGTTTIEDELLLQRWPFFEEMVKSYTSQNVEAKEIEAKEVKSKEVEAKGEE